MAGGATTWRPIAGECGHLLVDGIDAAVGEVDKVVVVVHGSVAKRVVALDANDGLDVAVDAVWQLHIVRRVALAIPHNHPYDGVVGNELLLEPLKVGWLLRRRRVDKVEALLLDLQLV